VSGAQRMTFGQIEHARHVNRPNLPNAC
jgi:hypothetical protein